MNVGSVLGSRCVSVPIILILLVASLSVVPPIPMAGADSLTTLSDGSSEATVVFPAPGENTSLSILLPKGSTVSSARLEVTGVGYETPTPVDNDLDFNDTVNNNGWWGGSDNKSSGDPASYNGSALTAQQKGFLKQSDDNRVSTGAIADKYAYQRFSFFVPMQSVTSIVVVWEGGGISTPQMGFSTAGADVHIYNNGTTSWELVGQFTAGEIFTEQTLTNTFSANPEDYIDDNGTVHVLATSPYGAGFSNRVETDFVKLTVSGLLTIYPKDPYLDVGDDGDKEWTFSGTLTQTSTVTGQVLVDELNHHIEAAGSGQGDVEVVLALYSASEGGLRVSGILIAYEPWTDDPPTLLKEIHSGWTLEEDHDAPDLINISQYFKDDHDPALTFEVVNNSAPQGLGTSIGPNNFMDVTTPTENWHGEVFLIVRATDSKGQYTDSNEFKITVLPINDPPALDPVGDLTATEGQPFTHTLTGHDVDTDFGVKDVLRFTTNSKLLKVDPVSGAVTITPTDAQVGVYPTRFTVTDLSGATDHEDVNLTVADVNNPPELMPVGDWTVFEDMNFLLVLEVSDIDARDTHTFTSQGDLFDIAKDGTIDFTPVQEDVGVHRMTFTVSDGIQFDSETVEFTVKNKNDPPVIRPIPDQMAYRGQEFVYTVQYDDEDIGYDPDEDITFSVSCPFLDIDPDTGEIRFTPKKAQVGTHIVNISATDNAGAKDFISMVLTVEMTNQAPVVVIQTKNDKTSFKVGTKVVLTGVVTDPDGDAIINYSWRNAKKPDIEVGNESVLEVKAKRSGKFTYILRADDGLAEGEGRVTFKVKAEDKGLLPGFGMDILLVAILLACIVAVKRRTRGT